ncbi:hypothetical protein iF6_149 [Enterococcus phage iF6]|uniref:Uncharacterized protein n=1 Tax=Enterococcus phage iF6 TaxID=2765371 RepID=A0A7G8ZZ77_9CAUD|nr:hypothetical protein iF6_149 [Enterococcus phage iF6]
MFKRKKYYVVQLVIQLDSKPWYRSILVQREDGHLFTEGYNRKCQVKPMYTHLDMKYKKVFTEKEIRAINPDYMYFAVEVTKDGRPIDDN